MSEHSADKDAGLSELVTALREAAQDLDMHSFSINDGTCSRIAVRLENIAAALATYVTPPGEGRTPIVHEAGCGWETGPYCTCGADPERIEEN